MIEKQKIDNKFSAMNIKKSKNNKLLKNDIEELSQLCSAQSEQPEIPMKKD